MPRVLERGVQYSGVHIVYLSLCVESSLVFPHVNGRQMSATLHLYHRKQEMVKSQQQRVWRLKAILKKTAWMTTSLYPL